MTLNVPRGMLAIALAAVALVATPTPSVSQSTATPTVVRIAAGLSDTTTPLLYAQSAGLFARAGLTVQIQRPQNGAATGAALIGGSLEIGKSSLIELINAHERRVPFVWIAPSGIYRADTPDGGLVVARDSPLRTGRDFNGKTIAAYTLSDLSVVGVRAWVDANGGDSSTLKIVELPQGAMAEALINGRIDGAAMYVPMYDQVMATGKVRLVARTEGSIAKRYLTAVWFTTASYADAHPDVIIRFEQIMRDANAYCNTHTAETLPLIAAFSGMEPGTMAHMIRSTNALYLDTADVQPVIDAAAKYKLIDHSFPAAELFSPLALKPH